MFAIRSGLSRERIAVDEESVGRDRALDTKTRRLLSVFRASASRIRAERARRGRVRLEMQTKLFAAGLINVNHRAIVMKLH